MDLRLTASLLLCAGAHGYMVGAPRASVMPHLATPTHASPLFRAAAPAIMAELPKPDADGFLDYGGLKIRTEAAEAAEASSSVYDDFQAVDASGNPVSLDLDVKEKLFLDCLDAYYNEGGKQLIPDDDYEKLKMDLSFSESKLASYSSDEIKYLLANKRWKMGKPSMEDKEYDELRKNLKAAGSTIALRDDGSCNVKDGVCKNDLRVDKGKNRLLYLPGVAAGLILSCELSFWTLHLDPIFSLLLAVIPSYFFGKYFTENIFAQKPLVTTAPCPECGSLMTVYFGDLLSVQTDGIIGAPTPPQDEVMCKCGNCKSDLKADRTRMIIETLPNPAKVAA